MENRNIKKAISFEGFFCIALTLTFFYTLSSKMGLVNMFNTLMNTGHQLLLNVVFYILAIAVITGAVAGILSEFGVIAIINKLLSPLMKPLYDLPGASTLGILTTYLSDNPAIITLSKDRGFLRYFKKYQVPALTNLGTAFGMGLIVTTFMIGQSKITGENFISAALIGNVGVLIGSVISVRIMLHFTKKEFGTEAAALEDISNNHDVMNYREIREGTTAERLLSSMLEGGKSGVDMGMAIIPGVLIICTLVLMLTNGPGTGGIYTGAAYEGVPLLPWVGEKISFILKPLFGFTNPEAIAFPITSLGAVGAAISLVPTFLEKGLITANDIAVFTAMGMCWSGYLSTHVAMMDALGCRKITGKAIFSHTIGGLFAGISAHFIYMLLFN
ncbi:CD0519/CD1768 family membrane protein [Clostridium polynesiense]|uniref:CD0519/CD1768 family membrane protein n=1 Tax=Clostridium polynesiense TaxID=1325933 RepID=UPI00058DF996|nr:membrane protein [Clostridium polynesiense]